MCYASSVRLSGLCVCLSALLAACGGEVGSDAGPDGSFEPDGSQVFVPVPPAPPAPVAPPTSARPVSLAPCAEGWTEVPPASEGAATWCAPSLGDGPTACGAGTGQFPDAEGCSTLRPCAETDLYPSDAPGAGDVRYVAPSSTGDGSRASPFGLIAEALEGAGPSTVIVLSAGTHLGGVEVPAGVSVLGVCPARTSIVGPDDAPALLVGGADVAIEGVEVRGLSGAIDIAPSGTATLAAVQTGGDVSVQGTLIAARWALRGGEVSVPAGGRLTGSEVHAVATTFAVTGTAELRETLLEPAERGVSVSAGGRLVLAASVISGGVDIGIDVDGTDADAELTDVLIRGVDDGRGRGHGIWIDGGASLTATRVALTGFGNVGLEIMSEGTRVELASVAILEAAATAPGDAGSGLRTSAGARLTARGVSVEGAHGAGVGFFQASGDVSDLTVLDTQSQPTTSHDGTGLAIGSSHVAVRRAFIRGNHNSGVVVSDPGAQLRLEDARVESTRPGGAGRFGRGVVVQTGAKLNVARLAIVDNQETGLFVAGPGSAARGGDVSIAGMRAADRGPLTGLGVGLHVQEGGLVQLSRVDVRESIGFGVIMYSAGTLGRLTDLVVADTQPWEREAFEGTTFGRGIDIQQSASLELERAIIENNRETAVVVSPNSTLAMNDMVIRGTLPNDFSRLGGHALDIHPGGRATGQRILLEGNREIGVFATGEFTTVSFEDIVIRGTMETACAVDGCPPGGIGVGAYGFAAVTLSRFTLEGNVLAGVHLASSGDISLSDGTVRSSLIGASVEVVGYDLERLSNRVRYEDNGTNLDSVALPVPQEGAVAAFEGET